MEDAEDLSQEIMMEVVRSVHRYKRNANLYTWIYRITVNRSLDHLRRQKRRSIVKRLESLVRMSNYGEKQFPYELAISDTRNEDIENRKILDNAISSLPRNQKIAFILNKYDELPYIKISEIMNISLSSVESLIFRARINLQKKLVCYFSEYSTNKK
jgi:RNA polymerase sigma-70 factor, ECF subfamily